MYIPETFTLSDPTAIVELLRDHPFGLLITAAPGKAPVATHLPVLFDADAGPHGTLRAHMARANPQWQDFAALEAAGGEALAVFQGPHGYISPRWYGPGDAVPTWNYLAVHAYGPPRVIEDAARTRAHQEDLVATFEAGAADPWSMAGQDERYIARMLRGIVAFEMPVARLEAKAKLSQNKAAADRAGVIAALERSPRPEDQALAAAMGKLAQGNRT